MQHVARVFNLLPPSAALVKGTVAGARKIESLRGTRLGNPWLR